MSELLEAAKLLLPEVSAERNDSQRLSDRCRFIEILTFADPDEILAMLHYVFEKDYLYPVWARNLAYRLACLQRPNDPDLLREAAADLYLFGDWNDISDSLEAEADRIDPEGRIERNQ
ncbi:hypothetical protein LX15_003681 [Streptoalloteichus tenebrarius]|uniref:HEAT repeat domain-containing protein n=1 Tax=Streptoalloteichus tenebrarius (strain ATCC 17920 / DSM 40477 / JCM 4838 / CBS 697.72 / NBRC 16177 / NCIMB 11028 / NRRL B-12390 / A12253. 1 / ISP 5477) TaxID=1933 RepID=A0ABT1HX46_STRSD|nr:hypothetical protein [Streptoalloteichus tenebrarius]MCP2259970.1 hypothetical protein [Streptoalloteichus tenebrarius]BFF03921.1 hypothetical protein GCM10020241_55960 [Streptoalloteichus tenebrarius]